MNTLKDGKVMERSESLKANLKTGQTVRFSGCLDLILDQNRSITLITAKQRRKRERKKKRKKKMSVAMNELIAIFN